jgi:hypothetical protein
MEPYDRSALDVHRQNALEMAIIAIFYRLKIALEDGVSKPFDG